MNREAWRAAVHRVAKSRTQLRDRIKLNLEEQRNSGICFHSCNDKRLGGKSGSEDGGITSSTKDLCTHAFLFFFFLSNLSDISLD